jgi:Bacterial regulatory proteins, luxR family
MAEPRHALGWLFSVVAQLASLADVLAEYAARRPAPPGATLAFFLGQCSNLDIARRLHLADKTVRNHVSNVFAKLQVSDRPQAIVRARQAGLGTGAPGQAPGSVR